MNVFSFCVLALGFFILQYVLAGKIKNKKLKILPTVIPVFLLAAAAILSILGFIFRIPEILLFFSTFTPIPLIGALIGSIAGIISYKEDIWS